MANEWSILIYLATAGVGTLAFYCVVRDEIRLKTYQVNELVERVQKERKERKDDDLAQVEDDHEPMEVQPAPGVAEKRAMSKVA